MYCFIRILTRSMSPDFEWERRYILVVLGYAGNKQIEETFEVTAEEYMRYEIGNTFIQDAVLENKEGDE